MGCAGSWGRPLVLFLSKASTPLALGLGAYRLACCCLCVYVLGLRCALMTPHAVCMAKHGSFMRLHNMLLDFQHCCTSHLSTFFEALVVHGCKTFFHLA